MKVISTILKIILKCTYNHLLSILMFLNIFFFSITSQYYEHFQFFLKNYLHTPIELHVYHFSKKIENASYHKIIFILLFVGILKYFLKK